MRDRPGAISGLKICKADILNLTNKCRIPELPEKDHRLVKATIEHVAITKGRPSIL